MSFARSARIAPLVLTVMATAAPSSAAELRASSTQAVSDAGFDVRRVVAAIEEPTLAALVEDALARNPEVAATQATARAASSRPAQLEALPDPVVGLTYFPSSPETRVGPQQLTATLSQRLPWFGRRSLRSAAAQQLAGARLAQVEARRLALVTEVRRLFHEVAFLDALREVVETDRATLEHYEGLARARYASGIGIDQVVVKIQAEITKDETRLLEIATRRAALVAALNALRDRPQQTEVLQLATRPGRAIRLDANELRARALGLRPELAAADAEITRAQTLVDLAHKDYKPDVTLALRYTRVAPRTDPAGVMLPENGKDILGISASLNLPIKRKRLRAGIEEAAERRLSAVERKRAVVAAIDGALGDLVERVSLTWRQLRLLEDVLVVQAEESLRSAEAAYSAGTLGGLDLLDAERVLLDVRTSIARARADYAISLARLEGTVGEPLSERQPEEKGDRSS